MTEKRVTMKLIRPKLGVGAKTWIALSAVFWVPVMALLGTLFYMFQEQAYQENLDYAKIYLKSAKGVYVERAKMMENLLPQISGRSEVQEYFLKKNAPALQELLLELGKKNTHVKIWIAVDEKQKVIGRRNNRTGDVLRIGDALSKALITGEAVGSTELVSKEFLAMEEEGLANRIKDVGMVQFVISPVRHNNTVVGAVVSGIMISGDPWVGNTVYNKFGVEMAVFGGEPPESSFLHSTASLPRSTWVMGQQFPKVLKDNVLLGKPYYGSVTIGDVRNIVAFEPIMDSQNRIIGAFGVSLPTAGLNTAVLKILGKGMVVAALIGFVIAVIVVFFIYSDITRPIKFLAGAMERFGKGEMDLSVDLKTGDEFEKLADGFNIMADCIRNRESRLSKHYEVAKLLMSTLDLRELVEKMLKIVLDVTDSQMGILYLSEEGEEEMLVPHVHYGTKSGLSTLKVGEGHPGRAALDKKTIIMNSPQKLSDEVMELGFAQVVPNEVAYIPLVYQERVLGVLVLGTVKEYTDEDKQIFEYLSSQISIALDNAIMHQKIQELSITDPLTRLYNRRYLNARAAEEWARVIRHNQPLTIILSDADNFKKINDTYGHDKGDEVLKGIAEVVRKNIRKEDIGARFGGEEFVIVLPDTDGREALILAERIRSISENKVYEWMGRSVTLSVGVATFPDMHVKSFEELIQAADHAMYKAKVAGKNRVVVGETAS